MESFETLSSDDFDEKQLSSIILLPNQLSFLHSRKCVQMKLWPMFDHHTIIYWGNSSYCMLENKARTRVWPIKTSLLCILLLLQDKNSCVIRAEFWSPTLKNRGWWLVNPLKTTLSFVIMSCSRCYKMRFTFSAQSSPHVLVIMVIGNGCFYQH